MRDVLVHVTNFEQRGNNLRYAADLATLLSGSLTGIYVTEPLEPMPLFGLAPIYTEYLAEVANVAEQARRDEPAFHAWAKARGVPSSRLLVAEGFLRHAIANAANWHDVLVLESHAKAHWSLVSLLGEILVTCGVPCIVVPEANAFPAKLDTVLAAWDGSVESTRAIHAALPLLRRAKSVIVIDGSGGGAEAFHHPPSLEGELSRHGIAFERRVVDVAADKAGELVLEAAWQARADLLVMGAYGHARYSEWMFGGATRHVLTFAQLPVFMRH
jgi:nucleotide-binding universal stress UspA family protein